MQRIGLAVWLVALVVLPAPLAARILLLAPLVVVPQLLAILPRRPLVDRLDRRIVLLAALALVAAFLFPAGVPAAVLALPWLAVALVGLAGALRHGLMAVRRLHRWTVVPELGVDVALGFWAVGAAFAVVDRLGAQTGFSPAIVLLTATHFHFAGFGLLTVASVLAAERPWLRASVVGLVVGIPVTALGFVLVSDAVNAVGALLVGSSGIGVGFALLVPAVRDRRARVTRLAGVALLIGMPMAIAWSLGILTRQPFLDLELMVRTHGVLNSTAVLLSSFGLGRRR